MDQQQYLDLINQLQNKLRFAAYNEKHFLYNKVNTLWERYSLGWNDLSQELGLYLLTSDIIDRWEGRSNFTTYLNSIINNYLYRKIIKLERSKDAMDKIDRIIIEEEIPQDYDFFTTGESPEDLLIEKEMEDFIDNIFTDIDKRVLAGEISQEKAAELEDKKPAAYRQALSRKRKSIKDHFDLEDTSPKHNEKKNPAVQTYEEQKANREECWRKVKANGPVKVYSREGIQDYINQKAKEGIFYGISPALSNNKI